MNPRHLRFPMAGLAAAAVSTLALVGAGTASAAPTVSTVTSGLNAPAHLAFGPGGHLFFAESGSGSQYDCFTGSDAQGVSARYCSGGDGEIREVLADGQTTDVFGEIPAIQQMNTGVTTGVDAVTFNGGHLVVLQGYEPVNSSTHIAQPAGGVLREQGSDPFVTYTVTVHGKKVTKLRFKQGWFRGAFISGYATSHPQSAATVGGPSGSPLNASDPSDVVPYDGGYAVTDAGADDVLQVSHTGHISVITRLATQPENAPANTLYPGSPAGAVNAQADPTALTVGPDGALYVAVSRDVPGLPGTAEIDRVSPGQAPVPVVTGLTSVSDLAFARDGKLLILQANSGASNTAGALLSATLNPSASVTAENTGISGLENASGLAISASGNVFISNDSIGDRAGEVLKVSGLLN